MVIYIRGGLVSRVNYASFNISNTPSSLSLKGYDDIVRELYYVIVYLAAFSSQPWLCKQLFIFLMQMLRHSPVETTAISNLPVFIYAQTHTYIRSAAEQQHTHARNNAVAFVVCLSLTSKPPINVDEFVIPSLLTCFFSFTSNI